MESFHVPDVRGNEPHTEQKKEKNQRGLNFLTEEQEFCSSDDDGKPSCAILWVNCCILGLQALGFLLWPVGIGLKS